MKGFGDFKRKAVVCIPNEDELKRRLEDKKEKGNAYAMKDSILHGLQGKYCVGITHNSKQQTNSKRFLLKLKSS